MQKKLVLLTLALAAAAGFAQKYLVISGDQFVPVVQQLADWKTQKGVLAKVVPVSSIGNSASAIQSYIRNAWSNWPVRPEFVLLMGAPDIVVPYSYSTDCNYGDMTGDFKMEIAVGRLPARTMSECSTMVNKMLAYERPQFGAGDTSWYIKATTVVREDNPPDQYYQPDAREVRGYWTASGYALSESLMNSWGHNSASVNTSASDGRSFITYRGQGVSSWWSPFNTVSPSSWNNGHKMPVVVGATCATLTLSPGESMYADQFVRAGTPSGLGGAVCYFGTTSSGSRISGQRSAVYRGFFAALYVDKIVELGNATVQGRRWVDSLYPGQTTRYLEWNLMGDPELNVWTGMPRRSDVTYDSIIPLAPQAFPVTVRTGVTPVAGARVCAWMDSVVYVVGVTDGAGQARLDINPTHVGEMRVTVTGRNLVPFEGTVRVMVSGAPYLVAAAVNLDDIVGNHDRLLNPGERVRLSVSLRNLGGAAANGVQAVYRCQSPGVTVFDSLSAYGTILPDSTGIGDPVELAVDSSYREGELVEGTLHVRTSSGDSWRVPVSVPVYSGILRFHAAVLVDSAPGGNGNGRLGASESGRLRISIRNAGGGPLEGVTLVLRSLDSTVVVDDSLGFYGRAFARETLSGTVDAFGVTSGPAHPPTVPTRFAVSIRAGGGTYSYSDTFTFAVAGEQSVSGQPTGPDAYGYWCYDDTDTESGRAPVYSWFELASPGPGVFVPVVSDSDAGTTTLQLPFTFRYYGSADNFISVCSNGFLALGYTTYRLGSNKPIPDTAGPSSMIAPFWDDLNPDENRNGYGTAYQYYDTTGHRWILQYTDFAHYNQPSIREKFQVVLYDPAHYPTPTGDGEIVMLYNRVALGSGCTVGIEDQTETRGIQYLYNNSYDPGAAWLQAGRALRFTTHPPVATLRPWLVIASARVSDSLHGNRNGVFEAGETLNVVLTVRNRGTDEAANSAVLLRSLEPDCGVVDSIAVLGTIPAGGQASNTGDELVCRVSPLPGDSIIELGVVMTANGYTTTGHLSFGLTGVTGVAGPVQVTPRQTVLGLVRPLPMVNSAAVQYSLARAGRVDLALFDAAGRRVQTLAQGSFGPGLYGAQIAGAGLADGVYFCRLAVDDAAGVKVFTRKVQVAR
ncbi:MAG: C25 family cysteine peptidase [bacterium]